MYDFIHDEVQGGKREVKKFVPLMAAWRKKHRFIHMPKEVCK